MAKRDQLTKANELYSKGDPGGAADLLEPLLDREPDNIEAHLLLARCYSRMRMGEDSVAEIEDALALEPENATAHALRGAEHYFADELDEAVAELERAMEIDPRCVEAHVRLAQVHIDLKQFDRAEELLSQAEKLAADGSSDLALVRMGQVYLEMQRQKHSEALEIIADNEGLIAGYPYVEATIRSNQAIIYARQRDYERSRDLLIDALDLDPYFVSARALLGQIAVVQRDYELAADQLRQVIENDEDVSAQVYYALATSLSSLGKNDEAQSYYREALDRGLSGFPGLTAKISVLLPDRRLRMALGVVILAILGVLFLQFLSPFMTLALIFGLGLIGWQIIRGH